MSDVPPHKKLKQSKLCFTSPTRSTETSEDVNRSQIVPGTGVYSAYYVHRCGGHGGRGEYNCLFEALAHQLNRPLSDAVHIRGELVEHLRENSASFSDVLVKSEWMSCDVDERGRHSVVDLESYLQHMSKQSSYGDGIMLEMALAKYKRPICIVSSDFVNGNVVLTNAVCKDARYIYLAYTGNNHYDSILPWPTTASSSASIVYTQPAGQSSTERSEPSVVVLPCCWTEDQWIYFKNKYPWLYTTKGCLGCLNCKDALMSGIGSQLPLLSREWCNGTITSQATDKKFQQKQLRKKVNEHATSKAHKSAQNRLADLQKETFKQSIGKQCSQDMETTSRIFRTVYFCAKKNRPFLDHPDLVDLQEQNGLDMGRVLHSNTVAVDIAMHIASEMRKRVCNAIRDKKTYLTIMLDESTSFSNRSAIIIFARGHFGDASGAKNVFFDLVEQTGTTAAQLKDDVLGCFYSHGITKELLVDVWIGFCSDGASVMTGRQAGLATLLQLEFPNLVVTWHCLAHRLELAVGDSIKEVAGVNHFKIFVSSLYATYSMSPRNVRQLSKCAADLEVEIRKIGKILDTRWVASSFRTVSAVWQNFPALCQHFVQASTDMKRDSKERSKYRGLHDKLASTSFVSDLAIMLDALKELKELSEVLQRNDITIVRANQLIVREIRIFRSMKERDGLNVAEASKALELGTFKDVALRPASTNVVAINKNQFFESLATNLEKRLSPNADKELVNKFKVLEPDFWPDGDGDVDMAQYGEQEIADLCTAFRLPATPIRQSFRDFKDNGGKKMPDDLKPLIRCLNTLPASNADCERGFSEMNLIMTPSRASLDLKTTAALMFMNINGPPLSIFSPIPYVTLWLAAGRRSADSKECMKKRQKILDAELTKFWQLFA